jgi:hypothetical protein
MFDTAWQETGPYATDSTLQYLRKLADTHSARRRSTSTDACHFAYAATMLSY